MRRLISVYSLLAGAGDGMTGVLLVGAPGFTLELLAIPVPAEPIYLRFVGVFVGCVGLAYLYPFLLPGSPRRWQRQAVVLEVTALVRLAVALFLTVAMARGALAVAWITVLLTDLSLAAAQGWMLWRLKHG